MDNRKGYRQILDTLTALDKKYSEQKFYTVDLVQYIDFDIGRDPFRESILKNRIYSIGENEWDSGDDNGENVAISRVDIEYDAVVDFREKKFRKISYGFSDIEELKTINNFDPIEAKLEARKKSWDLMLQERVFVGSRKNSKIRGLLNLDGITIDTTTLAGPISAMDTSDVQGLAAQLVSIARQVSGKTSAPNTFLMPENDYIKCCESNDPQFQLKTRIGYLKECFEQATAFLGRRGEFRILPTAFSDTDSPNVSTRKEYLLYTRDPDTMVFDVPLPFITKSFGSVDQMYWESVALGQIGSVRLFRPKEVVQFNAAS
jgi:hypothetical protein